MSCCQCGSDSKYKCPTCKQPYCSVRCCKIHKETPCTIPTEDASSTENSIKRRDDYEYPSEDTVPLERLKLLENSSEVKKCLENPHVRAILEEVDKAPHPEELLQRYMQEPIFTEYVDECLKIVQHLSKDKT